MTKWAVGAALTCSLLLAGCTDARVHEPQDPEGSLAPLISGEDRQANDIPRLSVARDDLAARDELVMSDQIKLQQVLDAATASSTAEHAEDFALRAIIYLADDQNGSVGPREIATLVAAGEEGTAQYIYSQMGIPERLGFEPAKIDVSERPWLRTEVVAPDRVRTGMTVFVLYPGVYEDHEGMWVRFVTESVYANGAWQLSSWNNFSGSHNRQPTKRDLHFYFDDGRDWRRSTFSG